MSMETAQQNLRQAQENLKNAEAAARVEFCRARDRDLDELVRLAKVKVQEERDKMKEFAEATRVCQEFGRQLRDYDSKIVLASSRSSLPEFATSTDIAAQRAKVVELNRQRNALLASAELLAANQNYARLETELRQIRADLGAIRIGIRNLEDFIRSGYRRDLSGMFRV
jgi:hypothetical protein